MEVFLNNFNHLIGNDLLLIFFWYFLTEGKEGQDFTFTMDRTCFDPSVLRTTYAEKFLLMGKARNSTAIHLDSRSIAYDLEDMGTKDAKIHFTIKRVIDDFKKNKRQLTC